MAGRQGHLKEGTRFGYASHIRLSLAPVLVTVQLDELRDWHVEEMYAARSPDRQAG